MSRPALEVAGIFRALAGQYIDRTRLVSPGRNIRSSSFLTKPLSPTIKQART